MVYWCREKHDTALEPLPPVRPRPRVKVEPVLDMLATPPGNKKPSGAATAVVPDYKPRQVMQVLMSTEKPVEKGV